VDIDPVAGEVQGRSRQDLGAEEQAGMEQLILLLVKWLRQWQRDYAVARQMEAALPKEPKESKRRNKVKKKEEPVSPITPRFWS
jgi:hypothetical protein